jgi:hypothetical protein
MKKFIKSLTGSFAIDALIGVSLFAIFAAAVIPYLKFTPRLLDPNNTYLSSYEIFHETFSVLKHMQSENPHGLVGGKNMSLTFQEAIPDVNQPTPVSVSQANYKLSSSIAHVENDGLRFVWYTRPEGSSNDNVYGMMLDSAQQPQCWNGSDSCPDNGEPVDGVEPEFLLSGTNHSFLSSASIAASPVTGDYVVVWSDFKDIYFVYGMADGTITSPEKANTYSPSFASHIRYDHDVDINDQGEFIITWTSQNQGVSGAEIYGKFFTTQNGQVFRLQPDGSSANDDVPEQSYSNPNCGGECLFSHADGGVGFEFKLPFVALSSQKKSSVSLADDGSFVVAWVQSGDDSTRGIYAQRYAPRAKLLCLNGSSDLSQCPTSTFFKVSTFTPSRFNDPYVIQNGSTLLFTWTSQGQDSGTSDGVYGKLYAHDGSLFTPSGSNAISDDMNHSFSSGNCGAGCIVSDYSEGAGMEFRVNNYAANDQNGSQSVFLSDGSFVITWMSQNQGSSNYKIYLQRYSSSIEKACYNGGSFPSSCSDDGDDANGMEPEFRVSSTGTFDEFAPSIAPDGQGGYVLAWQGNNPSASDYNIYYRRVRIPQLAQWNLVDTLVPLPRGGTRSIDSHFLRRGSNGQVMAVEDSHIAEIPPVPQTASAYASPPLPGLFGILTPVTKGNSRHILQDDGGVRLVWESSKQVNGFSGAIYGGVFDWLHNPLCWDLSGVCSDDSDSGNGVEPEVLISGVGGVHPNIDYSPVTGTTVVVWDSFYRIINRAGQMSDSKVIHTFHLDEYLNRFPDVALNDDDKMLIVWQRGTASDSSYMRVVGKYYDLSGLTAAAVAPNGTQAGEDTEFYSFENGECDSVSSTPCTFEQIKDKGAGYEFMVPHTYSATSKQNLPQATFTQNNDFVVIWQDTLPSQLRAQYYVEPAKPVCLAGSTECPSETSFKVNTFDSYASRPQVDYDDNTLLFVWDTAQDEHDAGSYPGRGVYGKLFDLNGNALKPAGSNAFADIPKTSFDFTDCQGVCAGPQVLNGVGYEFRVNNYTGNNQYIPSSTFLSDGGFVVSWESLQQGSNSSWNIFSQRFNRLGKRVCWDGSTFPDNCQDDGDDTNGIEPEFKVSSLPSLSEASPYISANSVGGYVVSWIERAVGDIYHTQFRHFQTPPPQGLVYADGYTVQQFDVTVNQQGEATSSKQPLTIAWEAQHNFGAINLSVPGGLVINQDYSIVFDAANFVSTPTALWTGLSDNGKGDWSVEYRTSNTITGLSTASYIALPDNLSTGYHSFIDRPPNSEFIEFKMRYLGNSLDRFSPYTFYISYQEP